MTNPKKKIGQVPNKKQPQSIFNSVFFYVFVGFIMLAIVNTFSQSTSGMKNVPLGEVVAHIKDNAVQNITVSGDSVEVLLKDGSKLVADKESTISFDDVLKNNGLDSSKISGEYKVEHRVGLDQIITPILTFGFPVLLLFLIFRQMRGASGDVFAFGKSRAKVFDKGKSKITFRDVAGIDEAKRELMEIVDFLKNPQKYRKLGARIPKGVLLVGSSGVGKTLLARAVAGEAGVPFFSAAGSEFMEMLVGVGSSRVRDLFRMAREGQPSLIFIDEIDAIGRQRGMGIGGGHDEREQTLNQILVEMDGFDARTDVIVLAASVTGDTNILIKENNETKLLPIGKFIDEYYSDIDKEGEIAVNNIQALSYEKNGTTISSKFTPVKSIFRHKVDRVYEIEYLGGKVKATGNHSVFVWESDQIKSKPVSELEAGNVLVDITPQRIENIGREFGQPHLEIDVYNKDIGLQDIYEYVMVNKGVLSQEHLANETGFAQTTISLWHRGLNGPRELSKNYYRHNLPDELLVTPEFCRLLGYFTAEGYARKEIDFCFNENEHEYLADVKYLMNKYFGLSEFKELHRTHNAVNLVYQATPVAKVFLKYCGQGAHNKHIPPFLFEASFEHFKEYLLGLQRGDGHIDKRGRLEITSVSKQLITELTWIARMHGMKAHIHNFTTKEGRTISGGKPLKSSKAYRFGLGAYYNIFNDLDRSKIKMSPRRSIIKSITKKSFDGFVYDLCGCGNEAFFGGDNPILLHNTNRPDMLDPALIRPGRFDRTVTIPLPDLKDREEIIKIHMRGKPFEKNVQIERIAKKTVGFSGADLENMLNESAILAARAGREAISQGDLEEAALKVTLGSERKTLQTEEEKKLTAYHEAGHALVSVFVPEMDAVSRVSIVARGGSLGHTSFPPERDRYNESKTRLESIISTMLGGRSAEELVFNEMSVGASDDINKATGLARRMVTVYGMSSLGPIAYLAPETSLWLAREMQGGFQYSQEMAAKIDHEVVKIINECHAKAIEVLTQHRVTLDKITAALLEKETLYEDEFKAIIDGDAQS